MRVVLLLLAIAAIVLAAPTFTTYTVRGKYYEGCLEESLCECAANEYGMSGSFDVASLPAGVLIDNIKLSVSGTSRYFTGVAVLHQNDTVTPHTQVGDFILRESDQTYLLNVEEEYTTPFPEILVGYASEWNTCFSRAISFYAEPKK